MYRRQKMTRSQRNLKKRAREFPSPSGDRDESAQRFAYYFPWHSMI